MVGSIFNGLNSILNSRSAGQLWTPKSSRVMVGRDVGALSATVCSGESSHNIVVGHGDDVTLKSKTVFDMAKAATQSGKTALDFRSVSDIDIERWKTVARHAPLFKNDDYSISFSDGILEIKDRNAASSQKIKVTDDVRISWNEDGSPKIIQGARARTKGVLAAQGENEILIRSSRTDVEAGQGSMVLNLNQEAGAFTGGSDVTFLGAYSGGTFSGMSGKVTYAGYFADSAFEDVSGRAVFSGVFENAAVNLTKGQGEFSGYFSASSVSAMSEMGNRVSGLFLNSCSVETGEGKDTFNGRFINSQISGGDGDDTFGSSTSASGQYRLKMTQEVNGMLLAENYQGIEADFVNSGIDAGDGDDRFNGTMWGGTLNLGNGDDTAQGVFSNALVNGGDGDDTFSAAFADGTIFNTGIGNDMASLATAIDSIVETDEGTNRVTLGADSSPGSPTWQTRDSFFGLDPRMKDPMETGELSTNRVSAERGETTITVRNGEGSQTLSTNMPLEQTVAAGMEDEVAESPENSRAEDGKEKEDAQSDAASWRTRTAIGAYTRISGAAPKNRGSIAATITTGNGETHTLWGAEREDTSPDPQKSGIFRAIRRYQGNGVYDWGNRERLNR